LNQFCENYSTTIFYVFVINISKILIKKKMNDAQADKILDSMVAFIEQHGKEEVARIEKTMQDDYTIGKNRYIADEKAKIAEDFKNKLDKEEMQMKIDKSKQ